MKRLYLIIVSVIISFNCIAQGVGEAFYIYRNDGEFNAFFPDEVDSITYSNYDLDSVYYENIVVQAVYTQDSTYRIPLAAIDSVSFNIYEDLITEIPKQMLGDWDEGIYCMTNTYKNFYIVSRSDITEDGKPYVTICMNSAGNDDPEKSIIFVFTEEGVLQSIHYGEYQFIAYPLSNDYFFMVYDNHGDNVGSFNVPMEEVDMNETNSRKHTLSYTSRRRSPFFNFKGEFSIPKMKEFLRKCSPYIKLIDLAEQLEEGLYGDILLDYALGKFVDALKLTSKFKTIAVFSLKEIIKMDYELAIWSLLGDASIEITSIKRVDENTIKVDVSLSNLSTIPSTRKIPSTYFTTPEYIDEVTLEEVQNDVHWGVAEGKSGQPGLYLNRNCSGLLSITHDKASYSFTIERELGEKLYFRPFLAPNQELQFPLFTCIRYGDRKEYIDVDVTLSNFKQVSSYIEDGKTKVRITFDGNVPGQCSELSGWGFIVKTKSGSFEQMLVSKDNIDDLYPPLQKSFTCDITLEENDIIDNGTERIAKIIITPYFSLRNSLILFNYLDDLNYTVLIKNIVTVTNFKQTNVQYSKAAFEYKGKKYDFCYNAAVTATITNTNNVEDWGYVYEDLNGDTAHVSLKAFGSPYTDTRYVYYRNEPKSYATLYGYVKYFGDENYYHGGKTDYPLVYDKKPVATTLEPTFVDTKTAKVKCAYKESAPWKGTCGVEYWNGSTDRNGIKTYFETANDEIEIPLNDLLPNTTYYYQAFIKVGEEYAEDFEDEYIWAVDDDGIKSFTTLPVVTFQTGEAKDIKENSALLTGTATGFDWTDERIKLTFDYSTEPDVINSASGKSVAALYDENYGVSASLSGLTDYTTYYYTLGVKCGDHDISYGEERHFRTNPKVATLENPAVTDNSVTLHGTCSKGITVAGFSIKKDGDTNYVHYGAVFDKNGSFSATIDGLKASSVYSYYAFIKADDQTFKGEEHHFRTSQPSVTYSTGAATNVKTTTATLNGTVNFYAPNDESVKFKFFYHTDEIVLNGQSVDATYDGVVSVEASISDLQDNTTYYYALAVKRGDADYISHNIESFKTLPVVTTLDNAFVTSNSVTLQGTCSKGITLAGFSIRKDGDTEFSQYSAVPDEEGHFSATIDNLDIETLYVYYAFVKANEQIYKGEEYSFTTKPLCPDDHHPHMIDLGLPSGTKWACCNVGASNPEDYGNYYAWGETMQKSSYIESTCNYYGIEIGASIINTNYDVANVSWHQGWHLPTENNASELIADCKWSWGKYHDTFGMMFTSKSNGNKLFLPAAAQHPTSTDGLNKAGSIGHYWLGNAYKNNTYAAWHMGLKKTGPYTKSLYRWRGITVRPVR